MTFRDNVKAKADILLGQMRAARKLADKHGLDRDECSAPYLEMLDKLYREEWPLAEQMDREARA